MAIALELPSLGESVIEGTVSRWLVGEGDYVEMDQPVVEVTTDKVDAEIPSPSAGVIEKILAAEGEVVEVGAQLPDRKVEVVLAEGQPSLVVRESDTAITVNTDDLAARITVRLPEDLKDDLEAAAQDMGDSVNTFVVRSLAGTTRAGKRTSRATFKGTIET